MAVWRLAAWGLAVMLLLPTGFLLFDVASTSDPGESWDHVRSVVLGPAVRDSLILVAGVCLLALALGVPAAWCVSTCRFPGARWFSVLLVLPLAVPPYVAAYATTEAREAMVPLLLGVRERWGIDAYLTMELAHRFGWLTLMLGAVLYPYVFLAGRAAFTGAGRRRAEAGRMLGAGPVRVFLTVSLPMARPALVAGLFLVALEVLNDYGAVHHLGVTTVTVAIFRTWFGLGDIEAAQRLAGWVLLAVLAVVGIERWQRGRARYEQAEGHGPPRHRPGPAGTMLCWLACAIPVAIGLVFPVVTLVRWLWARPASDFGSGLVSAAGRSLLLSASVAVACVVLGVIVVGVSRFSRSRSEAVLARSSGVAGYAAPGAVMALGVLGIASLARRGFPVDHPLGSLFISGSLVWLIYALTARYFAVGGLMVRQGLDGIGRDLDGAAACLGRGPMAAFVSVHLPLLKPALAGAAVLVFVDVCKELPLTLILRPFDFETLGTWTFGLANQGKVFACAAPSLVLIAVCAVGLAVVEIFGWRRR